MKMDYFYDPPLAADRPNRPGYSASESASGSAPLQQTPSHRQSRSSFPTGRSSTNPTSTLSDEEQGPSAAQEPLVDLDHVALPGLAEQDPADAAADRKLWREGRQSKQQLLKEDPSWSTGDLERFMAQLYDLTHAIDALENDVDEIVSLCNKIATLKPSEDLGQDLKTWLLQLHKWNKDVKKIVGSGQAGETRKEVGEIKFQLANAKLDFADAMERIREGAYKEHERRERTRIWMARHIRAREPDIDDHDVKGLLVAAELGAADGVQASDMTSVESYAGLWALQNPFTFTELAKLTNGMRFLYDDLGSEIVGQVTGKSQKKRVIYLNGHGLTKEVQAEGVQIVLPLEQEQEEVPSPSPRLSSPSAPAQWFGSRFGFISTMRPQFASGAEGACERKFRYIQAEQYAAQKDLEYGFAGQEQLDRTNRRKKRAIALRLVILAALILFSGLGIMRIPNQQITIKVKSGTKFKKIYDAIAKAKGMGPKSFSLTYDGDRINDEDTPESASSLPFDPAAPLV
ncbi:hypothetical protein JCM21900_005037 [Sporobolomyces salmonicolor]